MGGKAKNFWKNLPFAGSGTLLVALLVAGNSKKLVLLVGVAGLAAAFGLGRVPAVAPWIKKMLRPFSFACAGGLAALCGLQFATSWHFQGLADRLGISAALLVDLLAVLVALLALPAALAFCAGILAEEDSPSPPSPRVAALLNSPVLLALLLGLAAVILGIQGYYAVVSRYIWADEVFTLKLIRHSVPELVALTAVDVHPPLYYLMVKAAVALCPALPAVAVAKLTSLLPTVLLAGGAGVVGAKKKTSRLAAGLFAVCVAAMPSITSYSLEIRMYSWGLFFVTACYVAAWCAAKDNKKGAWVAFVLCGLAAAYTHYFACIAVMPAYLLLLGCGLAQKPRRVKAWLAAAGVTVLGYLPWLVVLLGQLHTVKESYWIQPITAESVAEYLHFSFGGGALWAVALFAALLLVDALMRRRATLFDGVWALTGMLTPLWVVLVGVAASLLIRPVFMERYLLPALGCLWLGTVAALNKTAAPRAKALAAALLVLFGIANLRDFVTDEAFETHQADRAYTILDGLPQDTTKLVSTAVRVEERLAGMTEYENYVWGDTVGSLPKAVYDNLRDFTDEPDASPAETLRRWVDAGDTVYFIEHESAVGTAAQAAEEAGLQAQPVADWNLGEPLRVWQLTE